MATHNKYGYLSPLSDKGRDSAVHYVKEWFYTTDAKRIGIMYIIFALTMGVIGAFLSLLIRAELFHAGPDFMDRSSTPPCRGCTRR